MHAVLIKYTVIVAVCLHLLHGLHEQRTLHVRELPEKKRNSFLQRGEVLHALSSKGIDGVDLVGIRFLECGWCDGSHEKK